MSISYIDGTNAGVLDSTSPYSVSMTIPTTVAIGDLAIMAVTLGSTTGTISLTTPSGWTQLGTTDSRTSQQTAIYYRTIASGDAGTTVTITASGATSAQRFGAVMVVYRGCDPTPTVQQVGNNTSGTTINAPTISVPSGGALLEVASSKGTSPGAWTQPAGFTLRQENHSTSGSGDTTIAIAGNLSGGTGGDTWTLAVSTGQHAAFSIALAPKTTTFNPTAVTSTGWTRTGGTGDVNALTDGSGSTFLASSANPSALALVCTLPAITQPAAGQSLFCDISADSIGATSSAILVAKLFQGATLISTSGTLTLAAGTGTNTSGTVASSVTAEFPAADLAAVTDWTALSVRIEATAS